MSLDQGRALVRAAGGRPTGSLPLIRSVAARLPARARAGLAADARVASVSANARVRSEHEFIESTGLTSVYPRTVSAPTAWRNATGDGVGVAVIDTGVDGRLLDFTAEDGSSRVVASVVTNPDATTALDTYGHGTHVAGIIAGNGNHHLLDNDHKYIGIAPGADLIAIKASDDAGNATILDAIYGLQFAVDHKDDYNIRVVNLSLSSTEAESYRTDPLDAAVEAAYFSGIVVVAAAGNRGPAAGAAGYAPGNDPFAISVGASRRPRHVPARGRRSRRLVHAGHHPGRLRKARHRRSRSPHRVHSRPRQRVRRAPARAASSTASTSAWAGRRWRRRWCRVSPP